MATEDAVAGTEAPIAAFAVAKGGVVLKHIFLNVPPPEEARRGGDADPDEEEEDPPVLFGRHPDCHVLLDHPSISRRHLELRCTRRQRRIAVTDLSSGTQITASPSPRPPDYLRPRVMPFAISARVWAGLREL
jgi:hypothetical protein